ncbi:MAG: hypothetical protein EPN85_03110 [Bacteroidetes bacterium]|nr:MAG: hypothetical protein EPN85_03110 [Bacteroidota bacterium]
MAWKLIQDSFTYVDFVFTDGNVRRFYSLDWPHRYSKHRDRELGLKRLRNLVAKYSVYTERAKIAENDGTEKVLERYEGGTRIE